MDKSIRISLLLLTIAIASLFICEYLMLKEITSLKTEQQSRIMGIYDQYWHDLEYQNSFQLDTLQTTKSKD